MKQTCLILLFLSMIAAFGIHQNAAAGPPTAPQLKSANQDLEQQVLALGKRLDKMESDKKLLADELKTNRELLVKVFGWFRQLPIACEGLVKGVERARTEGFEGAGPNPRAKRALLGTIEIFSHQLKAFNPVSKVPKKR